MGKWANKVFRAKIIFYNEIVKTSLIGKTQRIAEIRVRVLSAISFSIFFFRVRIISYSGVYKKEAKYE